MIKGWDLLNTAVAEACTLIAAHSPDPAAREEGEAYVARVVASSLAGALLGHHLREHGLTRALPSHGGPNPDYLMRHAPIDPSRRYRLIGTLNGSERVGVGLYRPDSDGGAPIEVGYAAFDRTNCSANGGFALELVAGPAGLGALSVPPDARILLIRILHRDPGSDPAELWLEGAAAAQGLAPTTGNSDGALALVAHQLLTNIRAYLDWTKTVFVHPNRFDRPSPELASKVQGDPDTQYFLGSFDLAENEYLEVTLPDGITGYWSLHAYNFWFEHLQVPGIHDRNAKRESDGAVRVAIGPVAPDSFANRIATLGRRRGALICRVVGSPPLGLPGTKLRA